MSSFLVWRHLKTICLVERDEKVFTVRPVTFWMDKLLEPENSKQVTESTVPTGEHTVVEKTMADSYMEEYLPLKSSPELLEEYIFFDGRVRLGKILEDLDALAGAIAYKHVDNPADAPPVTIVTASVDRLDLLLPNQPEDLKLSGHVAYVGKSSMEVFIKVEKVPDYNVTDRISTAPPPDLTTFSANTLLATRFTMVAIDSATLKSVKVNSLKLLSPQDHTLFRFAEDSKARKRRAAEVSLSKTPPTQEERLYIHDVYLKYSEYDDNKKPLPKDMAWMEDTRMESNYIMQPQDRNIHNNIFGGYLMRRAYELAFADASIFLKSRCPNLLSMDEVTFRRPVHVGSLLKLTSHIVYAEGYPHRSFQVRVVAEVADIEKDLREVTNVFYFTLSTRDPDGNRPHSHKLLEEPPVRRILPRTYAESMLWLEGKRGRVQGVRARQALMKLISNDGSADDQAL
ncbi:acyl-CoA thioester hydrolase [Umbelopsis sp. PMI_123]|nr:acyl-CoA thioester hydrolase [Umbelopsis sp. PMI_123]